MILVTGATGNVGRELVTRLLERGEEVRALTRNPERSGLPGEVQQVRGDLSDEDTVAGALRDTDAAFLNLFGTTRPVADALAACSTSRVALLSSVCAETRFGLPYADNFRRTEQELRAARSDLVSLRPGQFLSNLLWWKGMIQRGRVMSPFADVAVPAIDPADIAEVAAVVLTENGHAGADYALTGAELTSPRQRVEVLSRVLDRPIELVEQTEEQFRQANQSRGAELLDYFVAMTGHPLPAELEIRSTVHDLTGHAPRTLERWINTHQAELLT